MLLYQPRGGSVVSTVQDTYPWVFDEDGQHGDISHGRKFQSWSVY